MCRPLRQTCSLDSTQSVVPTRTLSVDESVSPSPAPSLQAEDDTAWSSDYTNSEEDEPPTDHVSLVFRIGKARKNVELIKVKSKNFLS